MIKNFLTYLKESDDLDYEDEEDIDDFITDDEFRKFLMNNNAYDSYLENFNKKMDFEELNKYYYISAAFVWEDETEKGFEFWENLSREWIKSIDKKSK